MIKNKKGQIAEGLTWIVATIAIIVILLISIVVTSSVFDFNDTEIPSHFFASDTSEKSFLSYLLTKEPSGEVIYSRIKSEENLNEFNGNLGSNIFKGIYGEQYRVWLGVSEIPEGLDVTHLLTFNYVGKQNPYFGEKIIETVVAPGPIYSGFFQVVGLSRLGSSIYLDNNKNKIIEVILAEK